MFYIPNLPYFSSFHLFCLHIKVNNNNLSTLQTGKIHENFQYLFNKIRGQFRNFPPRRRGPGRGLGGLYSIECPRIGGKKTISLKRFFSPTRAPAGPPQNLFYPLAFTWGPSIHAYKGENTTKKKIYLHRLPPWTETKKNHSVNIYPCLACSWIYTPVSREFAPLVYVYVCVPMPNIHPRRFEL